MKREKLPKFKFVPNRSINAVLLALPFVALFLKHILYISFLFGKNYYEPSFSAATQSGGYYIFLQLAVIALLVATTLMFRGNGRYIYALIMTLVVSVFMLIDVCYARYFNDLPSVAMAATNLFSNDDIEGGTIVVFPFIWLDVLFFADFIVWFFIYFAARIVAKKRAKLTGDAAVSDEAHNKILAERKLRVKKSWICATVIIAFSAIQLSLLPILSTVKTVTGLDVYQQAFLSESPRKQSIAFTSLGYHMYDIYTTINPKKKLTDKERAEITDFYRWNQSDYKITDMFGKYKDKNVIFIQLESFENFMLGQSIQGQEVTPNLNKLLNSGYHFTHLYDQVSTGNSSDCDLMTFTSILPASGVSAFKFYGNNTYYSLSDFLNTQGYFSGYYNALKNSYWNYQPMVANTFRFDKADFDFDVSDKIHNYISDGSMLTQFAQKLKVDREVNKANGLKTYAHTVLNNSHMPFRLPDKYNELVLTGELNGHVMGNYLNAVHYTDKMIGVFMETAKAEGWLEDSVFVFLGDHRGIHKYYPDDINRLSADAYEDWFGRNNDVSQTFIIYDPAMTEGVTVDAYGGQVDVMPTLFYLLGVPHEIYAPYAMGRPLFGTDRNAMIGSDDRIYGYPGSEEELAYLHKMYRLANNIQQTNYFAAYQVPFTA